MAIPNFDRDKIPYEGSPTFRADANYVWATLPDVVDEMNTQNNANNVIATQVSQDATASASSAEEARISKEESLNYKNEANDARNDAVSAKESIEDYVIPTEATLSPDAINTLVEKTKTDIFFGFNL